MIVLVNPLFRLGQTLSTPGAVDAMRQANANAAQYLFRHAQGDWGEVCAEDKAANDDALKHGSRLLSAYTLKGTNVKIWIITEADRSCTTILLPDEY
jgi:hypothetical protein